MGGVWTSLRTLRSHRAQCGSQAVANNRIIIVGDNGS